MKKPGLLKLGPSIPFYDNTVILRFCDNRDGKKVHEYYRQTPEGYSLVTGVTTACGVLDKSLYLMPWACKVMEKKLLNIIPLDEKKENTLPLAYSVFADFVKSAKTAHKEILVDAGDVGNAAHAWIEKSIQHAIDENDGFIDVLLESARPEDERAVKCGEAALSWMLNHSVKWLKTERKIYSKKYDYAGTMDGLALVDACNNPACCDRMFFEELSLIDWKSSNSLKTEYLYQTAAYEQAEEEEFDVDIESRWILRLGKEDGKFEAWYERNFDSDFQTFLNCLNLLRTHRATEERISTRKKEITFRKKSVKKPKKGKTRGDK